MTKLGKKLIEAAKQAREQARKPPCDGLMTCAAAKYDGVVCADDTCDFDTGVRKPPATTPPAP